MRRQVCGKDFAAIKRRQITIPVIVPWGLENFLLSTIPQDYNDLPEHFADFPMLISIHDASQYATHPANNIPSLHDTAGEKGNLRYWVITNESMWSNQHRVLDEIAELMWALFHWFNQGASDMISNPFIWRGDTDNPLCVSKLANAFRRRIILREVVGNRHKGKAVQMKSGLPTLQETLLFRRWALDNPRKPDRSENMELEMFVHFDEDAVLYPFPDDLFWNPEDVGTWDDDGVPEWEETSREQSPGALVKVGIYHDLDQLLRARGA